METLEKIGITSTVPIEVVYAAKCVPVDLNNIFISDVHPGKLIEQAERAGIPRNTCTWVKGIYSSILRYNIRTVIGVVQGDCTHVVTMLESLLPAGVEFIPFSYPYGKNRELLRWEIQRLMDYFGVQWDNVEDTREKLNKIRELAHTIDKMTWKDNTVTSAENFNALINCTDFKGDPATFRNELKHTINSTPLAPMQTSLRLGLVGVPGVYNDLYDYLETRYSRVVYHELARQFAMPNYQHDLLDQYLTYTYPYSVYERLSDIRIQGEVRKLDGYIHYVQSFCHHHLEDAIFKKKLDLPVLTLEGDRVGPLDGRTKTRIDAFLEMLKHKQRKKA